MVDGGRAGVRSQCVWSLQGDSASRCENEQTTCWGFMPERLRWNIKQRQTLNVLASQPQTAEGSCRVCQHILSHLSLLSVPRSQHGCRTPWHQRLALGKIYLQDMSRRNPTQEAWYTHRQTYYILWANHSQRPQQHKHPQDRNTTLPLTRFFLELQIFG